MDFTTETPGTIRDIASEEQYVIILLKKKRAFISFYEELCLIHP